MITNLTAMAKRNENIAAQVNQKCIRQVASPLHLLTDIPFRVLHRQKCCRYRSEIFPRKNGKKILQFQTESESVSLSRELNGTDGVYLGDESHGFGAQLHWRSNFRQKVTHSHTHTPEHTIKVTANR